MKDLIDSWLRGEPGVRLTANPETILSNKPVAPIVDLQRRYDIAINHRPWLRSMDEHYEAYDRVTFDPDPESQWHLYGYGASSTEAVTDLLSQIAALAVETKQ